MEEYEKERQEKIQKITEYIAKELNLPFVLVVQAPILNPFKPVDISGNVPNQSFNLELLHQAMILISNESNSLDPYNDDRYKNN